MSFDTISPTPTMCLPQSSHKRVGFHNQHSTWVFTQQVVHRKVRRLGKSGTLAFLVCGFRLDPDAMTLIIRDARFCFQRDWFTRGGVLKKGVDAKNPASRLPLK